MDTYLVAKSPTEDRIQLTMSWPVPAYHTCHSPMSNGAWRFKCDLLNKFWDQAITIEN